jgi:hypothetical protein
MLMGGCENRPTYTVTNATDLDAHSMFCSTYREKNNDIPSTSNNWVCSDFQQRRIVPTHCAIRSHGDVPAGSHVKIWLVETSADGGFWQEVAREEANRQLKGKLLTGTFKVAGSGECCFIHLMNIGSDHMVTSVCEIFGRLFEEITDSSDVVFRFCFSPARRAAESLVAQAPLPSSMCIRFGECGNLCGLDGPLLPSQTSAFAWFLQCHRYS